MRSDTLVKQLEDAKAASPKRQPEVLIDLKGAMEVFGCFPLKVVVDKDGDIVIKAVCP